MEYVYFFEAVGTNLVKVGFTENPGQRFQQIKTACPHELVALCVMSGNRGLEQILHQVLRDRRKNGEWFEMTDDARNILRVFGIWNNSDDESLEAACEGIVWPEQFADTDRQAVVDDLSNTFGRLFFDIANHSTRDEVANG